MKSPGRSKDLPQFIDTAKQLGFEFIGITHANHVQVRNPQTGDTYTTALTPSDIRSRRNAIATLERLSGRKLPRPNAPHYKKRHRQPVLNTEKTRAERQSCDLVDELVQEAAALRTRFHELSRAEVKDYPVITEARKILLRYEHLRRVLADRHRIIPTIESC